MFKPYENQFDYVNICFFCNRLSIELMDFMQTGSKSQNLEKSCTTIKELFDKYLNWTIEPKYSHFVNNLLQTEGEFHLFTQSLRELKHQNNLKYEDREIEEGVVKLLLENINQIGKTEKVTGLLKKSIDLIVDYLIILSDYSVIAQNEGAYNVTCSKERVSVALK